MLISPRNNGPQPRRVYSRLRLGISAQMQTLYSRQRVRLMDLSQGGAHVILSQPGDIREAMLTWLHFETFGMVAWQEDVHVGFKFDKLLPLGALVETRKQAPSVVSEEAMGAYAAARDWVAGTYSGDVDR